MLLKRRKGSGGREQARGTGNGEGDQRIELKMKLLTGLGFKFGFVRIFHFLVIAYVLTSFWKNLTMVLLRAHPVYPCGWSGLCRNLISRGMVPTPKSIVCFKVRSVQSHTCMREPYSPEKIHNRVCLWLRPIPAYKRQPPLNQNERNLFSFKMLQVGSRNGT